MLSCADSLQVDPIRSVSTIGHIRRPSPLQTTSSPEIPLVSRPTNYFDIEELELGQANSKLLLSALDLDFHFLPSLPLPSTQLRIEQDLLIPFQNCRHYLDLPSPSIDSEFSSRSPSSNFSSSYGMNSMDGGKEFSYDPPKRGDYFEFEATPMAVEEMERKDELSRLAVGLNEERYNETSQKSEKKDGLRAPPNLDQKELKEFERLNWIERRLRAG